jgi:hypothetical protein
MSRRLRSALIAIALIGADGCGVIRRIPPPPELAQIQVVAVLPIERDEAPPQPSAVSVEVGSEPLAPGAERIVTAQIYGVMAESPQWRFVPDLSVEQALRGIASGITTEERALRLGKSVGADGVFYGRLSRFIERQGSEFGSREPASVSFRLALLSVATGETVWRGQFDQTQQALSSNLLNWWQFWRAGPRWFSAQQLTRLGVEQLLGGLRQRMR